MNPQPQPPLQPQPQTPAPQLFNQPFANPLGPPPPDPTITAEVSPPPANKKLLLILGTLAGLELLVILGLSLVLASTPATHTKTKAADSILNSQFGIPQAATATGLQLTNDSITQDISNLVDGHDFPANQLDDKSLGL